MYISSRYKSILALAIEDNDSCIDTLFSPKVKWLYFLL